MVSMDMHIIGFAGDPRLLVSPNISHWVPLKMANEPSFLVKSGHLMGGSSEVFPSQSRMVQHLLTVKHLKESEIPSTPPLVVSKQSTSS